MDLDKLRASHAAWQTQASEDETASRFRQGLNLKSLYTPLDRQEEDFEQNIGWPGEFPYTRGVHSSMYSGRPWTIRQYSGYGTAEDTNARYRYLLDRGQTGLSVAFDLPTQIGLDSDEPEASDEVGRVGVAIDTLSDLELLFDGIPLERVTVSFTINSTAPVLLAMLVALADRRGIARERLGGTLQNDSLKEFIARGTWIFPIEPSLRLTTDVIEFCSRHLPRFNPISITGAHMKEAGADVVQELTYTFGNAVAYTTSVLARGLSIDEFAPRLSFATLIGPDFFIEIAKLRAARRIWARLTKEKFHAADPRSSAYRVFSGVLCRALTREFPLNNIFRVGVMGMASVLGGVQALSLAGYDEVYELPSEESVQISIHTQQILMHELGMNEAIDPLAGSYYVESITDQIVDRVWERLEQIEARGGMLALIEQGVVQREIANRAYEEEKLISSGQQVVVGSNRFTEGASPAAIRIQRPDPRVQERQTERLRENRRERNERDVTESLQRLTQMARTSENLIPLLIQAVQVGASIGETTRALKETFGEYREVVSL